MALYEMRTYTMHPGKMAEATKHYQEICYPVLQRGGFDKYLVGYFIAATTSAKLRRASLRAWVGSPPQHPD
jgi:hypothetical protein